MPDDDKWTGRSGQPRDSAFRIASHHIHPLGHKKGHDIALRKLPTCSDVLDSLGRDERFSRASRPLVS